MENVYQTNRASGLRYFEKLKEAFSSQIHPEEFILAEKIDTQKFYLEFKSRLIQLVFRETEKLKDEMRHSSNIHLIILKNSLLVDVAIQIGFQTAIWFYNKQNDSQLIESSVPIVLVARGGYGREEMYFRSNIDVQIFSKSMDNEVPKDSVQKILKCFEYLFIHQEIFSAPYNFTHEELLPEGPNFDRENPALFCSLLEHRFLVGNKVLYDEFASSIKTTELLRKNDQE